MFRKPHSQLAIIIASALLTPAYAADPGQEIEIGSISSVLEQVRSQHRNPGARIARALHSDVPATEIRDLFERDGRVSVSGVASSDRESLFYLKGDGKKLSGYLVLPGSKKAWAYRTNARGVVTAKPIAFHDVLPDYDATPMRAFNAGNISIQAVSHPVYSPMALRQARHIGPYNNEDVTRLESKPGSPYVFYLNTAAVMSGSTPLNGVTKEQMYRVWQSVADQYSMLNLNVTTNLSVYNNAKAANLLRTGVLNFVNQDGRSYAPLHSFGTTSAGTLFRNPSSGFDYGYGIGMTAAHEIGHQMGMLHDGGGSGGEYFEGISAFQWGPIMGNYWQGGSWAHQLFQWSKGEYNTATRTEDDLYIMTVEESVPYMADDNANGKPLTLRANGEIHPADNFGQIERNTDTDSFTLNVLNNSTLNLRIDPLEYLRMLDVDATIYDRNNAVVARSNLSVNRSAQFSNVVLAPGAYTLVIRGGAEGTPQNGFSNYSSLGWYGLQGTLVDGGTPPDTAVLINGVPVPNLAFSAGQARYFTLTVPANASNLKFVTSGGSGDVDVYARFGAQPSTTLNDCKSEGSSNAETCSISAAQAGTYHVMVYGYAASSGVSLTGSYTTSSDNTPVLNNGVAVGVSVGNKASSYYKISVPAGRASLTVTTSGASGDLDLYVRAGSKPTTSSYTRKSDGPSNSETITLNNPAAGDYYILVYGYTAASGATLRASY